MKSIRYYIIKIKQYAESREVLLVALILLVGLGAFGLGRLSKIEEKKQPIIIKNAVNSISNQSSAVFDSDKTNTREEALTGALVGSRNGSKYHFPWCSGAQRISEENKIRFSSKEEAEKAGYTPAANCKGL